LEKNICTWSDAVADIHDVPHGYSPPVQEAINFYAPEWREKITQIFSACIKEGISYDEEMEIITQKGKRVWVRTTGKAVKNEKDKIIKVQGSFQDITKKRKTIQMHNSICSLRDVVMPEMNGRDLAAQITDLYPDIRLLFMSGYTANVIAHRGVLDDGVAFIQKPFSMADMTVKVREVLDTASDKQLRIIIRSISFPRLKKYIIPMVFKTWYCTVIRMIVSKMDDIVQQLLCPIKMRNALTVNDTDFKRILTLL
jgi:PAS domain S-box-containing protein